MQRRHALRLSIPAVFAFGLLMPGFAAPAQAAPRGHDLTARALQVACEDTGALSASRIVAIRLGTARGKAFAAARGGWHREPTLNRGAVLNADLARFSRAF